jgi:hypothetical protein
MIHRLTVNHVDNQDLIKEMGEEAYLAAKKLGEQVQKEEERHFMYWDIYDEITGKYKDEYEAHIKAERQLRLVAVDRAEEAIILAAAAQRRLEKAEMENQMEKEKMEKQMEMEKKRMEKQMEKEKEKMEKEKEKMEKEKAEVQKLVEKEKQEAQKLVEKEKQEAQKLVEKEKLERLAAKKLLQEEQKKVRKLEKEQKKLWEQEQQRAKSALEQEQQRAKSVLEQKQIKLMHNLFAAGLSIDIIAKSLEVSIEQIKVWQKLKK